MPRRSRAAASALSIVLFSSAATISSRISRSCSSLICGGASATPPLDHLAASPDSVRIRRVDVRANHRRLACQRGGGALPIPPQTSTALDERPGSLTALTATRAVTARGHKRLATYVQSVHERRRT